MGWRRAAGVLPDGMLEMLLEAHTLGDGEQQGEGRHRGHQCDERESGGLQSTFVIDKAPEHDDQPTQERIPYPAGHIDFGQINLPDPFDKEFPQFGDLSLKSCNHSGLVPVMPVN